MADSDGHRWATSRAFGDLGGQVSDPLGGRNERAGPGRDRAHHRGEHHHQRVSYPAPLAWIDHLRQHGTQARREDHRIR